MRTVRSVLLCTLAFIAFSLPVLAQSQAMQFVPIPPCRLLDTRQSTGPIQGGTFQSFNMSLLAQAVGCQSLNPAAAYSINVTVVPHGYLGYLTIWPKGQPRPVVSLMNSFDGRTKADATIVLGGANQSVSVYVTDTADVILDVNGYFEPSTSSAYAYYSLATPCRLADTRTQGGQPLPGGQETDFPVFSTGCGIPANAQAYSLNFTAIPRTASLGYLTVWPAGGARPTVSTLNSPTGTVVANAALLPANGSGGEIAVYPSDTTDLVIDIDGYFALAAPAQGLAFYPVTPCRAIDTRLTIGAFSGPETFNISGSSCAPPSTAAGYVMNATALPQGVLGYLTLWPSGPRPLASTLNALDGAYASNMAIVGTDNGSIDAYAAGTTNLLLDLSGYMGSLTQLAVTTTSLPPGTTGQQYSAQLAATGGEPPYIWSITSGALPAGLTMTSAGLISGIPTGTSSSFGVKVTDQFNATANANLSITVVQGTIIVTTQSLPNGALGVPYSATLGAAGGSPPYTWSVTNGTLPDGLNLNVNTGVISGTPTTAGASPFTVQATDSQSNNASANLQIIINAQITNGSLLGHYAFTLNGYANGSPVFMAGSFSSDGAGNLLAGVIDVNSGAGEPQGGYSFTGTYVMQADGLGDMNLTVATLGAMHFSLSLSTNGNGQLILDNADPSTRGSGVLLSQTNVAFQPPAVGTYAIGTNGADSGFHRFAKAGAFTISPQRGNISSGEEDLNDNGTLANRTFSGGFFSPSAQTGRGQAVIAFPGGITNNYAYYVISSGQFVILGTDPLSPQDPLTLGTVQAQLAPSFNDMALSGNSIMELNGLNPNGGNPTADVLLGLANWNGGGAGTTTLDENNGGVTSQHTLAGTYNVEVNGRVTTAGIGGGSPILYLYNFNQGFMVGQGPTVLSGTLEQQTSVPPMSKRSIVGIYVGGSLTPVEASITDAVSFFQADGNGNMNGIQNYSGPSGPGTQNLVSTYQVDASGRAVVAPTTGNLGGIMYVVSAKKVVLLPSGTTPVLSTFSSAQTQ